MLGGSRQLDLGLHDAPFPLARWDRRVTSPVASYVAHGWFKGFTVLTNLKPDLFLLTILIALEIGLFGVISQFIRVLMTDPVHLIRLEWTYRSERAKGKVCDGKDG